MANVHLRVGKFDAGDCDQNLGHGDGKDLGHLPEDTHRVGRHHLISSWIMFLNILFKFKNYKLNY
jgi:hypothetical protein